MLIWGRGREQIQAGVQGSYTYEYWNMWYEEGTVEITGYTGNDTELVIPEQLDGYQVAGIGFAAFENCTNLERVELPSGLKSLKTRAFAGCTNLKSVKFPSGLESFETAAFSNCSSLSSIELPPGLENLGGSTFSDCSSLSSIEFPAGLRRIGWEDFANCSSLKSVRLPAGLTSVTGRAFSGCYYLEEIEVDMANSEYKSVNGILYSKNGETLIYCPSGKESDPKLLEGVGQIDSGAFSGCDSLQSIQIPAGVELDVTGLEYCENLMEIHVDPDHAELKSEDGILYTKDGTTLKYCPAGKTDNIHFLPGVQTIGYDAFYGCNKISSIELPDSVTTIESSAFSHCRNLKSVKIPAGTENIMGDAFASCDNLQDIHVDAGNPVYASEDGILYDREKTTLICYPGGKANDMRLLESVTEIGKVAFAGCTNLREAELPSGITVINRGAFSDCTNLKSIKLPLGLTSIRSGAFAGCSSLTSIEIPEGVTELEGETFNSCENLTSITIPVSMESIQMDIFSYYNRSISDIYYAGSKEQWEKIDFFADLGLPVRYEKVTIHYQNSQEPEPAPVPDPIPDPEPEPFPDEPGQPETLDAKQELERLKSGDQLSLDKDLQQYLSAEQIDKMESFLYTWLADINYAYTYSAGNSMKELVMKKAGIDPQGDFVSGTEQAITHISAETKYGPKVFEITLNLGKPDGSGNLYPSYGSMHYEILEKENIPSDVPASGQIGKASYADMEVFVSGVSRAADHSLRSVYQCELMSSAMASGVLIDKTTTEIIGNKNGSFSNGTFQLYEKPLLTYRKKITISCPVDVYIYSMDGKEVGSVINNKPQGGDQYVRFDVNGDTKSVYLVGNDYYLSLRGTDTGTMQYEVEEIANDEIRRNVQFLELQLKKDMQYEGYVFRPLNLDRNMYALRAVGSDGKMFYADQDTLQTLFKQIQSLTLSEKETVIGQNKVTQLNASLFPLDASNPALKWTTDRESVVRVDHNGLVTAVGAGRATVTVSTKDGSFLKQYCVIDVAEEKYVSGGPGSSSGWYGGGTSAPVEQEKQPVVVNLHYVLQFQTNGGTNLSRKTMTLLKDDVPGIMPKVQRKDYLFDGWYTQLNGGERITGDKPLTEAATLYARWTKAEAPAKPAAPALKSKKKGQIQVGIQHVKGAAGYEIGYSSSQNFASAKKKMAGAAAKTKTLTGLKAQKKYYVRVRAYCLDSMKNKIYGAYSSGKSVKVKS